jgi:hypothetical protein
VTTKTLSSAFLLGFVFTIVIGACGGPNDGSPGQPSRRADSGITGVTVAGPQCPVEIAGQPCAAQPVAARIVVQDPAGRDLLAFTSDDQGRFRVGLPPGDYVLVTTDVRAPILKPQPVTVLPGQFLQLRLLLDTGVR